MSAVYMHNYSTCGLFSVFSLAALKKKTEKKKRDEEEEKKNVSIVAYSHT